MLPLFLSVACPLFLLFLRSLSPTVPMEDGGEMVRAAFSLGVTHPPGYPLYVMLGRLFMAVPAGDPAFRINLLSAASGASACGILACAIYRQAGAGHSRLVAAISALFLGTGVSLWWQSVIAEKYAFNALLGSLCMLAIVNAFREGKSPGRRAGLLGISFGLWAGHHGQAVYFLPVVALALWRTGGGLRALGAFAVLFLAGFSPKLAYPPIRAYAHPLHNWNDPSEAWRWFHYILGSDYLGRAFYWGVPDALRRLAVHAREFLPRQFGLAGTLLLAWGVVRMARAQPGMAGVWALAAVPGTVFCAFFILSGQAIETYYIPVFLALVPFLAEGARGFIGLFRWRVAGFALLALFLSMNAAIHARTASRDRHYFAFDFSRNVLGAVPAGSILLAHGDRDLFPLWYVHDVLGYSPDILLVDANYLIPGRVAAPVAGRIQLLWPAGSEAFAMAFPFVDNLLAGAPGRPVFMATVFTGMESARIRPSGFAYRLGGGEATDTGDFRRWRTRGVFGEGIFRDPNTEELLSSFAMTFYWRGFNLMSSGRNGEALAAFRRALRWPDFNGTDRAALHGSVAWCLERSGDGVGALAEYAEAGRLAPERLSILKPWAALCLRMGRRTEAAVILRRITEIDPMDGSARAVLREIRAGL